MPRNKSGKNGHGHSCDHVTSRSSAGYITNRKYLYINKLYKNTHSFSLRSHGHSCDRVTIYHATILILYHYKYLYISMLYTLYYISCTLRSHGHSCDHVTIHLAEKPS